MHTVPLSYVFKKKKWSSDTKLLPNVLTTFAMKEKVKIAFLCVGLYDVVFSDNMSKDRI